MLANSFLRTEKGLVSYLKVGFQKNGNFLIMSHIKCVIKSPYLGDEHKDAPVPWRRFGLPVLGWSFLDRQFDWLN